MGGGRGLDIKRMRIQWGGEWTRERSACKVYLFILLINPLILILLWWIKGRGKGYRPKPNTFHRGGGGVRPPSEEDIYVGSA